MAELRCEQISASYGSDQVLTRVDLHVADATLTAILGASGSGKTTLLRVVMGFIRQDHGSVSVGGRLVSDGARVHLPPEKRSVGYVAQEGALYPQLTVEQNIAFGLPRSERKLGRRARELLALIGLPDVYADRCPGQLSGGEQRRVALARALAPRPPVVLLDEPFSGLDASLRNETREAVVHALGAQGTTGVLVTHDQAEALSMGREVAVLRAGRLVQTAAPSVLYRMPADLDVARFVGEAVVLAGVAARGLVATALGDLALIDPRVEGRVEVMIRPEQIELHPAEPPCGGEAGTHSGAVAKVISSTFYGPDVVVDLELHGVSRSIRARVLRGHDVPVPGNWVELVVVGPVMGYPASSASGAPASGDECVGGRA
ncbi:MAG TPA: ABC transporter ATP-binding protein [Solirubrobacteraceae bacterium]|nr:ABC transporter ATP-binding protein [Solirubrobacteraceae bacterium]